MQNRLPPFPRVVVKNQKVYLSSRGAPGMQLKVLRLKTARILKAARERQLSIRIYKRTPIRLSADFSTKTLQARRNWHKIFKVMKKQGPTTKAALPRKAII